MTTLKQAAVTLSAIARACLLAGGVSLVAGAAVQAQTPFAAARQSFTTAAHEARAKGAPLPAVPAQAARIVHYPSAVGPLAAYITATPPGTGKHPAIVWITGGDATTVDDSVFAREEAENDQTAAQYRAAGVITMYPSLRGGNDNPGHREGFYGEVDDVLAAADFLAKQPGVDPARIYLGGHSTGGTLVMLVAEASPRFRAAFAFGPVSSAALNQPNNVPFDRADAKEVAMRAPVRWLDSVQSPLFVFEGAQERRSNIDELRVMQRATTNPAIHFLAVPGADHFSDLAPVNRLLAAKIVADAGPAASLTVTPGELAAAMSR